jgi:FixJ family two-component response regulator
MAGALDYLTLPLRQTDLQWVLMSLEPEAAEYAEARRRVIEARNRIKNQTGREREVLEWLSEGSSNKAIARRLEISPRTVEIHRANMMAKLGANHPADAVRLKLEAEL